VDSMEQRGTRILVADDNAVSRRLLESMLTKWGYDVRLAKDGLEAYHALRGEDGPSLTILGWMMPGMDGIEVCQRLRRESSSASRYIILLTAKAGKEDAIEGLGAGADDYLTKPFDPRELRARLQVGVRVLDLQRSLTDRVKDLEGALLHVKQLQGLLPICSYCKKIRNDQDSWQQIEYYMEEHSEAEFSHGICPSCYEKYITPQIEKLEKERSGKR